MTSCHHMMIIILSYPQCKHLTTCVQQANSSHPSIEPLSHFDDQIIISTASHLHGCIARSLLRVLCSWKSCHLLVFYYFVHSLLKSMIFKWLSILRRWDTGQGGHSLCGAEPSSGWTCSGCEVCGTGNEVQEWRVQEEEGAEEEQNEQEKGRKRFEGEKV